MSDKSTLPNPFPGLRSFRSDEDYLFFGREEQTLELIGRLQVNRFIAVVGTSGRGKSSLVRCGLLSRLQGGGMSEAGAHWDIAVMHPGGDPFRHLATALFDAGLYDHAAEDALPHLLATLGRSQFGLIQAVKQSALAPGTNFLLVVDQFEEIFRYDEAGEAESEAANDFVAMLREACAQREVPIYIVTTMRSDFIGDCSRFEGLAEAVNRGEYLIPRLSRDQFKSAIEGPVRVAGGQIAPRLLQRLLNDLGDEQDQLPCLQHALMRTWRVWQGRAGAAALDLEDYAQVGKMSQALSVHADEVYFGLATDRQRELCVAMFKALTVEGSEKRGIRRPRRLQALCGIVGVEKPELLPVIEAFRHAEVSFLVPSAGVELRDNTVIDLSHESLMRVWTRLRDWVDEEAKSVGIFRRLSESAALWRQGKSGFYRDPELSIARAWIGTSRPNASWAQQYDGNFDEAVAFLNASTEAVEQETRAQETARQRELEQARALAEAERSRAEEQTRFAGRLKWFVRGLGLVAMVALAATFLAFFARREAQEHAQVAQKSEVKAARSQAMADSARGEAEKLVGFLLDDFYDELAPTGRIEMVGKLARQAIAYYDGLPAALRTPQTERNRAMALVRQGYVQLSVGETESGFELAGRAATDFERLRAQGDRSEETVTGLALAWAARGSFIGNQGLSAAATADMQRAVEMLRPVANRPGSSRRTRREFANLLNWRSHQLAKVDGIATCEEALQVLVGLGALDLSDLSAASAYGDVADSAARHALMVGRLDDAERLEHGSDALAVRILASRPGDLRAMLDRCWAPDVIGMVEARRFHPVKALEHAGEYERGTKQYVTFDPSNVQGWLMCFMAQEQVAQALLTLGRISDAKSKLRAAIAFKAETKGGVYAWLALPNCWVDLAFIAAQRGERSAAAEALREARQIQNAMDAEMKTPEFTRLFGGEFHAFAERKTRLAFGEFDAVDRAAQETLTRLDALQRSPESSVSLKEQFDGFRLAALLDSAWAAVGRGRNADAEKAARAAVAAPPGNGYVSSLPANHAQAESVLALALARQGRGAEAQTTIKSALTFYREMQAKEADGVDFRHDFAFALYAQALACADDSAGRTLRRASLAEAVKLLDGLTDEAKQLHDQRELMDWIAAAQAKPGAT
jgi:hypothetical protein